MKNNDFILTYRYTNASVEIVVMSGDSEAYKVDICKMLRMSQGRPWALDTLNYDMIDVADEKGVLTVLLENSTVMIMLTISLTDDGELSVETEWKNTSGEDMHDVMVGFCIPFKMSDAEKIVIPSLYYGEGIGNNGDFKGELLEGGGYIAEEHRLSIPFVSVSTNKHANNNSIAMLSMPSKCSLNNDFDNEWSMGIVKENDSVCMVLLSGTVMLNGQKDSICAGKGRIEQYERGYFDMPADSEITKKFVLYYCSADKISAEFNALISKSIELFEPDNQLKISYKDFLQYKSIALKNRFVESEEFAGYVKKLSASQEDSEDTAMHYTSMTETWTIDNLAAAWCDALNSLQCRKRDGILRAKSCVDFYINKSKCRKKGLRQLYLDNASMQWHYSPDGDIVDSFEFGLMVTYMADIVLLFKEHCLEIPETWTDALEDSCDFLSTVRKLTKEGIYPEYWGADGSIGDKDGKGLGITCVSALAKAYRITDDHQYITAAVKTLAKYYEYMILKQKPLSKKARREYEENVMQCDKDSIVYFMIAAVDCYEATHDEKILKMASAAAQILITYVNFIDYPLKRDSKLNKMGFDMRGLAYAGIETHAFNVQFPSYAMKLVGDMTNNDAFRKIADITANAVIQLVSTGDSEYGLIAVGEHPDLFYGTNWSGSSNRDEWRAGYGNFNSLRSLVWSFRQILKLSNNTII